MCVPAPVNKLPVCDTQNSAVLSSSEGIQTYQLYAHNDTSCRHWYAPARMSTNTCFYSFLLSKSSMQLQEIKLRWNLIHMLTHSQSCTEADNCSSNPLCIPLLEALTPLCSQSKADVWSYVQRQTTWLSPARSRRNPGVFLGISWTPFPPQPYHSRSSTEYSLRAASVPSRVSSQTGKRGTGSIRQSSSLQDLWELGGWAVNCG